LLYPSSPQGKLPSDQERSRSTTPSSGRPRRGGAAPAFVGVPISSPSAPRAFAPGTGKPQPPILTARSPMRPPVWATSDDALYVWIKSFAFLDVNPPNVIPHSAPKAPSSTCLTAWTQLVSLDHFSPYAFLIALHLSLMPKTRASMPSAVIASSRIQGFNTMSLKASEVRRMW
jgi:hypothetical protein